MFLLKNYMNELSMLLCQKFGRRLLYVGLQGSYLREEATETSDIDIVVVMDGLTVEDLNSYRDIISSLESPEKSCGFICGKAELANWNPLEIFHLLNSTKDYHGVLQELVPVYTQEDIRNFVKMSLNNLYHEICHRHIHAACSKNSAKLPGAYKGVFFILQDLYYLEHGEFIPTKAELLPLLSGKNHAVLERAMELNNGMTHNFSESFELLFTWCQDIMTAL